MLVGFVIGVMLVDFEVVVDCEWVVECGIYLFVDLWFCLVLVECEEKNVGCCD